MVYIPGGTFLMGLKKAIFPRDGESPQRYVTVSSFFLDKYEVSNEQFHQFVLATNFRTESELFGWSFVFEPAVPPEVKAPITQAVLGAEWWLPVNGSYWREPEGPGTDVFTKTNRSNYPAVQVTWNDAVAFCAWRDARLPTEAEWEYAAQGTGAGKTSIFPWGNKLTPSGIHRTNIYQGEFPNRATPRDGFEFQGPIDSYGSQNEYGLYNMIGNVWEWVEDWFTIDHDSYLHSHGTKQSPAINPKGPISGHDKVKKGGSFLCHQSYCYRYRTAARFYSTPDSGASNGGFRCARDVDVDVAMSGASELASDDSNSQEEL